MYFARPSFQHSRDNIVHIALKSSSDETLCKSSANTLPSFRPLFGWGIGIRRARRHCQQKHVVKRGSEDGYPIMAAGGRKAPRVSLSCLLCDVVVMVFLANKWRADVAAFLWAIYFRTGTAKKPYVIRHGNCCGTLEKPAHNYVQIIHSCMQLSSQFLCPVYLSLLRLEITFYSPDSARGNL